MSGEPAHPLVGLAGRAKGASHERRGLPCQDAADRRSGVGYVVVAVADGHGSADLSEVGARLAVEVGMTCAEALCDADGAPAALGTPQRERLKRELTQAWVEAVRAEGGEAADLRRYGSTLLVAVAGERGLVCAQIGDGTVLRVGAGGEVWSPIPADPMSFADETASLCSPEAWASVRVHVGAPLAPGELLMLSTDGYCNSYADDEAFNAVGVGWRAWLDALGFNAVGERLQPALERVAREGCGDDVSLAMIWAPTRADAARPVREPAPELERTDEEPPTVETEAAVDAHAPAEEEPAPSLEPQALSESP